MTKHINSPLELGEATCGDLFSPELTTETCRIYCNYCNSVF